MRLIALLLLLLPTAALSDGFQIFVGGGSVKSHAASADRGTNDAALEAQGFTVIGSNESTSGSAFTLGVGYALSRHFSVLAAYTDLGQVHQYSGTFTTGPNSGNQIKEWEGSGFELSALGSLPLLAGFSIEGKLGVIRMEGKYRTSTLILAPGTPPTVVSRTSESASGSGTLPVIGVGLSYAVTEQLRVRGMYERWANKSGVFGAGNDLDNIQLFAINVGYQF